jgi:hypothetical protein
MARFASLGRWGAVLIAAAVFVLAVYAAVTR